MENKRILEITRILLQQQDYITIQEIAALLQVSNKTVRNDLEPVAAYLEEYHLTLRRKTGSGIRIEGEEPYKLGLLALLSQKLQMSGAYSLQARRVYIGLRLITCTEPCRIYQLSSELFVSRATIHKDITALAEQFLPYQIQIIRKSNNGLSLAGKERHRRDLMFDLMSQDQGYTEFLRIVQDPCRRCAGTFIFAALDYTDSDIQKFVRQVTRSGGPYVSGLPFSALLTLLNRVFISLIRIIDGHFIHLSGPFMEELKTQPLYPEARQLTMALEPAYQVTFSEEELRYLQAHLLALQNQDSVSDNEKAAVLSAALAKEWERRLELPLTADAELLESLTAHLVPAITRIRHGINIKNPMMDSIRAYYPNTLRIVQDSLRCLTDQTGFPVSEDEAGYISMHLAAALDRAKQPLKTVLVCHGGIGASQLLLQKLSTQIPEIQIVAQESFLTVQRAGVVQAELIISTMELNLPSDIPVLQINALMYDHDLQRLKEVILELYKKKNAPAVMEDTVNSLPQQ